MEFVEAVQQPGAMAPGTPAPWARVLARKVDELAKLTKRPLLIYGSACTTSGKSYSASHLQIDQSDRIGFHDMLERLGGAGLDLLIHSPGGFPEAAEGIVDEIRTKYPDDVRVIVPAYAKSAATMIAFSADQILADEQAELGPIDPQMLTSKGVSPAESIKQQFDVASREILGDPKKMPVWYPIIQEMGPALLVQADDGIKLSKDLVTGWLQRFMFRNDPEAQKKAKEIAEFFGTRANFQTHARPITIRHINEKKIPLNIVNLRGDPGLYRRVWELYCMLDVMFANTPNYKIFYNSVHDAMTRQAATAVQQILLGQIPGPQQPAAPAPQQH